MYLDDNTENTPKTRSGHATGVYGRFMIIYGGIHDVCKELNDMHLFDMVEDRWVCLFEELQSPMKPGMGASDARNSKKLKKY